LLTGSAAQTAHAEATLAAVAAIPDETLFGMAVKRGIDVQPVGSLPERLIAAAMAGRVTPRQAGPRIAEGATILVDR
jgi:hypothetical protein